MNIKNGDLPAMPITEAPIVAECAAIWPDRAMTGLTKREQFAMAAMQGYCADGGLDYCFKTIAESAVGVADALLAELEKSK